MHVYSVLISSGLQSGLRRAFLLVRKSSSEVSGPSSTVMSIDCLQ